MPFMEISKPVAPYLRVARPVKPRGNNPAYGSSAPAPAGGKRVVAYVP